MNASGLMNFGGAASKPPFHKVLLFLLVLAAGGWAMDRATDQSADPNLITGPVTHIRDGDTIEVSGVPIRLNGLNCEERGSDLGRLATAAMRDLVAGQDLTCRLNGDRTYDREVGRCVLDDGRDIGAVLIGQGVCGRCARFDPQGGYIEIQRQVGPYQGEVPGYCAPCIDPVKTCSCYNGERSHE